MNEIKKTILHSDKQPNTDLYPKTSADQIDGLKEFVEQYSSDSIKVSITVPAGATNGTLTEEQLATLQASEANYIEMVNDKELYYLNDNGHVDGYLTYSHVGIENSKATIKTLTITVSAKSFVIVTNVVPTDVGGGKLYRHDIMISNEDVSVYITVYRSDNNEINTGSKVNSNLTRAGNGYLNLVLMDEYYNGNSKTILSNFSYFDGTSFSVSGQLNKMDYSLSDFTITDTVTEV